MQLAITYELNRDLHRVNRKVYGVLDWLGSIGGLAGALRALFSVLVVVFQYKLAINYVGNRLYKVREDEDQEKKGKSETEISPQKLKLIKIGFFTSIKQSF